MLYITDYFDEKDLLIIYISISIIILYLMSDN